ncbi:MAG: hypothetical protein HN778_14840 [Prolixibacteraceae bacterium]|jgi:hypothetical protein|nr:hypothetical protein [Prolixibacteraceae bacterium]MBT6005943.1 hypothetical protein [Prolixibacteraceae bacterium]MBT6763702.1 hypothetical protein [Prolixibacteraceae bacterium]MBT6997677.1 hypothetical protein [Prolixibacteraceae bacterium]MBT7396105.1 hypothetical protein [Prolixibacteraceae bacterium]
MKRIVSLLAILLIIKAGYTQQNTGVVDNKYLKLHKGSSFSHSYRAVLTSDIDTTWNMWKQKGYHFGFDTRLTPMFTTVDGILSTPYMIQVRGNTYEKNKKRWGYHVFEGYASDDKSRITMLVNKHVEEERPVAELYYYSPLWGHSNQTYNWFRIGSDVRQHSFMFSRDNAIFYGALQLTNALTLGRISKEDLREDEPAGDDEQNYIESAKHVNYKALKNSDDGTIFYDKENHIVVIKIDGQWMKLRVETLPENVKYDF